MRPITKSAAAAMFITSIVAWLGSSVWPTRSAGAAPPSNTPQNVLVQNSPAQPVPTLAIPQSFKMSLVYNQNDGTFPTYTVPANQRVIIRYVATSTLVPPGTAPKIAIFAPGIAATLIATKVSSFHGVQDRYSANDGVLVILEPGETLSWYIDNSAGEDAFTPTTSLNALLSVSGEVITLGP